MFSIEYVLCRMCFLYNVFSIECVLYRMCSHASRTDQHQQTAVCICVAKVWRMYCECVDNVLLMCCYPTSANSRQLPFLIPATRLVEPRPSSRRPSIAARHTHTHTYTHTHTDGYIYRQNIENVELHRRNRGGVSRAPNGMRRARFRV